MTAGPKIAIDFFADRQMSARLCIQAHRYPGGFQPYSWVADYRYDFETDTYLCTLRGAKPDQRLQLEVQFGYLPGTVLKAELFELDRYTGLAVGKPIGSNPYSQGGRFCALVEGRPHMFDWSSVLHQVHSAAAWVGGANHPSVVALRKLLDRHGKALSEATPGLTKIDPYIAPKLMAGPGAGPATEFGEHLQTCLEMAKLYQPSDELKMAIAAVANLWYSFGDLIEARFVFEPKIIHVNFQSRQVEVDAPVGPSPTT